MLHLTSCEYPPRDRVFALSTATFIADNPTKNLTLWANTSVDVRAVIVAALRGLCGVSDKPKRGSAKAWALGIIPDKINRQRDDWYVTPPQAVRALLDVVEFTGQIWEPACGDGAISKVLIERGHDVVSSDLIDRGFGETNRDFLLDWTSTVPNVITNPPFKHAEEFALHALERTTHKVALLCRLAWLEGLDRRKMFVNTPLSQVLVFSNRIPMQRNNEPTAGGMIAFAWYVWDHAHVGKPTIDFLVADKIGRPPPPKTESVEPATPDLFDHLIEPTSLFGTL